MKVTLAIFKSFYEINCHQDERLNIEKLARNINKEITTLAKDTKINDEKTLLLLHCLKLAKQLENISKNQSDQKIILEINNNINNLTEQIKLITEKIIEQI